MHIKIFHSSQWKIHVSAKDLLCKSQCCHLFWALLLLPGEDKIWTFHVTKIQKFLTIIHGSYHMDHSILTHLKPIYLHASIRKPQANGTSGFEPSLQNWQSRNIITMVSNCWRSSFNKIFLHVFSAMTHLWDHFPQFRWMIFNRARHFAKTVVKVLNFFTISV